MKEVKRMQALFISLGIILILLGLVLLSGCGIASGETQARNVPGTKSVNDVLKEREKKENTPEPSDETEPIPSSDNEVSSVTPVSADVNQSVYDVIDIDLTTLSSTLVYSEVYNIMMAPDAYVGKVIKMNGIADVFTDPNTGITYQTCIITDATACCAQGIEFELTEGAENVNTRDEVTVIGIFDVYQEGESFYCTLRNAVRLF